MADDRELEPTEPASQRRLEEARAQGEVARSLEFSNFAILFSAAGVLILLTTSLGEDFRSLFTQAMTLDRAAIFSPWLTLTLLAQATWNALFAVLPTLLALFAVAALAPLLIGGWLFAPQRMRLDVGHLNPVARGRFFSLVSAFEVFKTLLKIVLLAAGLFALLWLNAASLAELIGDSAAAGAAALARWLGWKLLALGGLLAVVALGDAAFRVWYYRRGLRMTRAELLQEYRESEGDPAVKARIRARQRQLTALRSGEAQRSA